MPVVSTRVIFELHAAHGVLGGGTGEVARVAKLELQAGAVHVYDIVGYDIVLRSVAGENGNLSPLIAGLRPKRGIRQGPRDLPCRAVIIYVCQICGGRTSSRGNEYG